MRSQEPRDHFTTPIRVDSTDSGDIRRQQPSYMLYNRDTYQMSPLLFESDTEDTSQSTEFKCYQDPADTAQLNTNDRQMLLSTLSNLRNEFTSPLDASSQHNQCCSETLLSSSHHRTVIETNTNSAYISPSPRVTRSKLWKSKILTRSAKRLHKISELNEYSSGPRSCRKAKTKRDSRKETRTSSDGKDTASKATDKRHQEESLIESIQKSKVSVVLERLKFPFFQNPHQVNGKFAQPNIVPNIVVDNEEDDGLEFLNRRPSSDVQLISEPPAIISISSESTVRNVSTTPRASPDLFENCDSSSASNLCSQNSIDIPNGQIAMRSSAELINSATSTPNNQQTYTLVQSIFDQFDEDRVSSDVNTARQKLIATNEDASSVPPPTFEITVNEVFDNVIYLTDSEETLTPEIVSRVEPPIVSDNVLSVTKCASSQEVTPKKRPEIRDLLNRSVAGSSTSVSTSFSRSKWLSKPRSSGGGDMSSRTPQRCRRLDRCFDSDRDSKPKQSGYVVSQNRFSNILLASSEDDEC
ncbi:uncharacterized protein LOC119075433 isoform X2 [Bradysia coprophila]|nr:uncharacterized protein LOC119075433 isoform X2 [Bradysia coprophila]XP_037037769.1 uncharacterized protein LOC119075433 isoform X2 [Bradysia coprophila]